MLGYEVIDQEAMVVAIQNAKLLYHPKTDTYNNLEMAESFLQGLWAEGYFD